MFIYIPLARSCVATAVGGPCGICSALWQTPALDCRSANEPFTLTRSAGLSHWIFTHG
jgi:hypothetical protein